MDSHQVSYERPRIVNIELGPRGSRSTEQHATLPPPSSTVQPHQRHRCPQFLLKCGKSWIVRWILILIALCCTFGIGFGAGGYVAWKQGFCEQNLIGHRPVVSGARKSRTNIDLAWTIGWVLVAYFFGTFSSSWEDGGKSCRSDQRTLVEFAWVKDTIYVRLSRSIIYCARLSREVLQNCALRSLRWAGQGTLESGTWLLVITEL